MKRIKIACAVHGILILIAIGMLIAEWALTGTVCADSRKSGVAIILVNIALSGLWIYRFYTPSEKTVQSYRKEYKDILEDAFSAKEEQGYKRKLYFAIYQYNQNRQQLAIRTLNALLPKCKNEKDRYAVLLFLALNFDELGDKATAIELYEQINRFDPNRSRVWSNLGLLYLGRGEFTNAVLAYQKSIQCDTSNPYAYNNLASALIKMGEFEKAIPYAKQALLLKSNLCAASNALAVCYSVLKNKDEANKYFKISLANGVDAAELRSAIRLYNEEI